MFRKEKKNKQTSDQITLLSYGYIHMYVGLIKKKKKKHYRSSRDDGGQKAVVSDARPACTRSDSIKIKKYKYKFEINRVMYIVIQNETVIYRDEFDNVVLYYHTDVVKPQFSTKKRKTTRIKSNIFLSVYREQNSKTRD